jgi:hypothetical protein
LFCSAEREDRGRNDTAFAEIKIVKPSTMKFEPISNRKSRLRIKEYIYNRTVINVFEQTETAFQKK